MYPFTCVDSPRSGVSLLDVPFHIYGAPQEYIMSLSDVPSICINSPRSVSLPVSPFTYMDSPRSMSIPDVPFHMYGLPQGCVSTWCPPPHVWTPPGVCLYLMTPSTCMDSSVERFSICGHCRMCRLTQEWCVSTWCPAPRVWTRPVGRTWRMAAARPAPCRTRAPASGPVPLRAAHTAASRHALHTSQRGDIAETPQVQVQVQCQIYVDDLWRKGNPK